MRVTIYCDGDFEKKKCHFLELSARELWQGCSGASLIVPVMDQWMLILIKGRECSFWIVFLRLYLHAVHEICTRIDKHYL
jgi:hypothetical protein